MICFYTVLTRFSNGGTGLSVVWPDVTSSRNDGVTAGKVCRFTVVRTEAVNVSVYLHKDSR